MNPEDRAKKRAEKLSDFNPNENGLHDHGIFGLPFTPEESEIVLVPVPWEVTVSYNAGTAKGPQDILYASLQIDLFDELNPGAWRHGIAMEEIPSEWDELSTKLREDVEFYLDSLTSGIEFHDNMGITGRVNRACEKLNTYIKAQTSKLLDEGKIVGLVGGDHSTPLGYLQALAERHSSFGILQIDAHADLRDSYEGFTYSHASIFYNALQIPQIKKLLQLGIRDFSEAEYELSQSTSGISILITDYEIKKKTFRGISWHDQCMEYLSHLPDKVYISFDVDGLDPSLGPSTGTPVPGGFKLEEVIYLFELLVDSGRQIIGFDLCEVAVDYNDWDSNVGSRILYKLCMLAARSKFGKN